MSTFPPSKANQKASKPAQVVDLGPVSTGKGGIPASLKIKAAGTVNSPGVEKTVNLF